MKRLLLIALAVACSKGADLPVIDSFTATPDSIPQGTSAKLAWVVSNASQIAIDNGVGVQEGHSVNVSPVNTTTYTMTATGLGGSSTATVTVTVTGPVAKPAITAFTANPADIATGGNSTLAWTTSGSLSKLTLSDGTHAPQDVTARSNLLVTPGAATTYTLTATNSGGSDSKQVTVTVHPPRLHLAYTDPPPAAAKLLLVRNAASTDDRLVLDLKVGATDVTAFGVAMSVPVELAFAADPSTAGPFTPDPALTPPGIVSGSINLGSSPATAAVKLGGTASQKFITIGVAKHKAMVGDGDDVWPAGATLFSLAFKLVGTPPTGNVFVGSTVAASPAFKAAALHKDGSEAVNKADIALGNFTISM